MTADQLHEEIQELLRNYASRTQTELRDELSWTQSLKRNIDVVVDNNTISPPVVANIGVTAAHTASGINAASSA